MHYPHLRVYINSKHSSQNVKFETSKTHALYMTVTNDYCHIHVMISFSVYIKIFYVEVIIDTVELHAIRTSIPILCFSVNTFFGTTVYNILNNFVQL